MVFKTGNQLGKGKIPKNKGKKGIFHHTEETKQKIAEAKIGNVPWHAGTKGLRKLSEDGKRRIGEAQKGNHSKRGYITPENVKRKISEANKGNTSYWKGKNLPEETKKKISDARQGKYTGEKNPFFGKQHSEETRHKISEKTIGRPSSMKGKKHSEETLQKMSEIHKGCIPWNKGRTGLQSHSEESKKKVSDALKGKKMGEDNPNWNGGTSFEPYCHKFNEKLREQIRERDGRTCQLCGAKENGRRLTVHHIHYLKSDCEPDLIALCIRCNGKVNYNRDHYEELFMSKLIERGLVTCTPIPTQKE
uniref:Homing endonuclease n=2 Tax=viral metagenome TaxID=1070528 RepID=A0A6H1ZJ05_9ZZZZ